MRPFEAALKGAREIGFTIVSITFSLIAVFIPVLLMGGMVGRVFREFAVTIAVAIIVSGFVSLTLTPMLCARMLRAHHEDEKAEHRSARVRGDVPRLAARLRMDARQGAGAQVVHAGRHARDAGRAPSSSTSSSRRASSRSRTPASSPPPPKAPSDISFQAMVERQRQVAEIVAQGSGGRLRQLDRRRRRSQSDHQLRAAVHRAQAARSARERRPTSSSGCGGRANSVTGMIVYFQNVQNINIAGRISKSEYQYTLQSSDTETLYRVAPELRDKIAKIDGLRDVTTDLYIKNPQMTIEIDREQAAIYGITVDQIRQELFNAFGSRQVATIFTPSNDYQVILESLPEFQADPAEPVEDLPQDQRERHRRRSDAAAGAQGAPGGGVGGVGTLSGPSIPLSAVTRIVPTVGPLQVNHQGQQPAVTISFNLAPGISLGAGGRRDQADRARIQPAGADRDRLPGHRAGVPGIAEGAGRPGPGGDLRRLCGARHPLRELHPSDHHHLRPAVGRRRRAADPDAVQDGPVGDRDDRHRHAGRHREEERDHDDRLRHRAPARRACPPRRRSARRRCCASARS